MTRPTILIVDDEPSIIDNITYALNTEVFATVAVNTGVDLRVYITDAAGVVIFNSDEGRGVGADYSQ